MALPLLAAKLTELRIQHELTQEQVARVLNITREGYNHYEKNAREPSLEVIYKLCQYYKIEVSELINPETFPDCDYTQCSDEPDSLGLFVETQPKNDSKKNPTFLTENLMYFYKLFSGRNLKTDYTDITKEDLDLLKQYKTLPVKLQQDVKDYVTFKLQQKKKT